MYLAMSHTPEVGVGRVFFRSIEAELTPEYQNYTMTGLFSLEDVCEFKNRKDIRVEMWVDEANDINVRLVSGKNYVDETPKDKYGEPLIDAVVVQFATAENVFEIPVWMVELTGRTIVTKGERDSEEGFYTACYAAGVYDAASNRSASEPGIVGEIKLLRRIY